MGKNILFKLSGSIAAYKSCELISKLVQKGFEVQVVATPSTLKFVGAATLEGLTRRPALTDIFKDGNMMSHVELNRWADLTVLCPATGNIVNEMAAGISNNLVTTLFLAHDFKKPYLVAPAMNEKMYQHPATQAAIKKLSSWGLNVLPVDNGYLGCGDVGEGRLLNIDRIYHEILLGLKSKGSGRGNVLVTSGGTAEPIDDVRAITNISSGKTAAHIAESYFFAGFDVTYVHATNATLPDVPCRKHSFKTFIDLQNLLREELAISKFDVFIHAAAVGDFFVKSASGGKIDSSEGITLALGKNIKLLNMVKKWTANTRLNLVGFKLTVGAPQEEKNLAIDKMFNESQCDYVVSNDLSEISDISHRGEIWSTSGSKGKFASKRQLSENLVRLHLEGADL
ncbi:MAG: bifunctional phosphopantothenoylcysteine decarboxylase/phosphopantothenate--cysteine ligase CoaBC [Pseudomonadota bacterium]|nr:bifunctional phosphopantothenoylcysteine decarboxylase/phosphopantothenate--cysteine ligase CoaBC [Pseudomonadota bacterium]